jgi:predicted transcriptional regulator
MVAYVKTSETSRAAARAIAGHVSLLAELVYNLLSERPQTCAEIEQATGLSHQTCSARFRELALANKIVNTGEKRPTPSGRRAFVWAAPSKSRSS